MDWTRNWNWARLAQEAQEKHIRDERAMRDPTERTSGKTNARDAPTTVLTKGQRKKAQKARAKARKAEEEEARQEEERQQEELRLAMERSRIDEETRKREYEERTRRAEMKRHRNAVRLSPVQHVSPNGQVSTVYIR